MVTNKEKYKLFCKGNNKLPVFLNYDWWEIITKGNWDIAISEDKNGEIRAIMPFEVKKIKGFKFILQPELTPYGGIYYFYPNDMVKNTSKYSFQNKHSLKIINQLPKSILFQYYKFFPGIDNWYPFYKMNFEQSTRYTYILNNIKDYDSIFSGFTNTLKRQIKDSQNKFQVIESDDPEIVFTLMLKSLARKNTGLKMEFNIFNQLDHFLKQNDLRNIFLAKDKDNNTTAGLYLVRDSQKAYLLGLGTDYSEQSEQSTKLLIWESIKAASKYVDQYDFEGSMIEGVERLYKSFGGIKAPYFELKKYLNKFTKIIFILLNK